MTNNLLIPVLLLFQLFYEISISWEELSELLFPAGLPHCSWPLDKVLGWIKTIYPGKGKWKMKEVGGVYCLKESCSWDPNLSWLPPVPTLNPQAGGAQSPMI